MLSVYFLWEVLFMQNKYRIRLVVNGAILIALEIVLNRILSINTLGLKIGLSFVPIVIGAAMYGPAFAAIIYALADLIGAWLLPIGPYHPGFTICAALMGLVYGWCLYQKPQTSEKVTFGRFKGHGVIPYFPNVVIPPIVNNIVIGLFINTCWVAMLYGSRTYWGWFAYRLAEYAILVPLQLIMIPILLRLCRELQKIAFR